MRFTHISPTFQRSLVRGSCAVALIWLAAYGCKKEEEVQYPPSRPQSYVGQAGQSTMPPSDAGAPLGTADAATLPSDAGVGDAAAPGDGGPPALNPLSLQLLEQQLGAAAKKHARGMKVSGDPFGATLKEGQQTEAAIMIEAQKCYSVVAVGGMGLTEVDIQVLAKPGAVAFPGPILAHDTTTGAEAAVSPCWKNPFPLAFPATVVVKATKGAGDVAARIYVK